MVFAKKTREQTQAEVSMWKQKIEQSIQANLGSVAENLDQDGTIVVLPSTGASDQLVAQVKALISTY